MDSQHLRKHNSLALLHKRQGTTLDGVYYVWCFGAWERGLHGTSAVVVTSDWQVSTQPFLSEEARARFRQASALPKSRNLAQTEAW